jgi:hypothetical protein
VSDRQILGILIALVVPGVAYVALIAGADPRLIVLLTLFGIIVALVLQVRGRLKK